MDTRRRNGYKKKEWIQGEGMNARTRNGYKEKSWLDEGKDGQMDEYGGWMVGWQDGQKDEFGQRMNEWMSDGFKEEFMKGE